MTGFFLPFDIGIGAILISLVMLGLGIFHLFTPLVGKIWLGLSFLSLFNPLAWKTVRTGVIKLKEIPKIALPFIGVAGFLFGLAIICALGPPGTKDDLIYHLYLPKTYLQHQGLIEIPAISFHTSHYAEK